jgi:hypothetical protein
MRARWFYVVAAVLGVLAVATSASAEEPTGFLEWPWGTPTTVLRSDFLIARCPQHSVSKDGDQATCTGYRVGDIEISQLTLYFQPDHTLTGYAMLFSQASYNKMLNAVHSKFGNAQADREGILWSWPSGTTALLRREYKPNGFSIGSSFEVSSQALRDWQVKDEERKRDDRKKGF